MPDRGLSRRTVVFAVALLAVVIAVSILTRGSGPATAGAPGYDRSDHATRAAETPSGTSGANGANSADSRERIEAYPPGVPDDPAGIVRVVLSQRGAAVTNGSKASWLATIDPRAKAFRTSQGRIFGRLTALKPVAWTYAFRDASALPARAARGTSATPGGWVAEVDLSYQLVQDGPTVVRHQFLTMVPAAGSPSAASGGAKDWLIANDSAGATQADLWDLGPITVTRAKRCVVISSATRRSLGGKITGICGAAAKRVDAVWGSHWSRQTTLVVPASQQQLATLLDQGGSTGRSLNDTAAVTVGPGDGAAEEVLINPAWFAQFDSLGIRVILTHELVHVATRATGSLYAPTWLEEGFADYVGYYGSGLSPRAIAPEALRRVDQGKIPSALPRDGDFDSSSSTAVAAAYGFSWAAITTMAEDGGTKRVVQFYKSAAAKSGSQATRVNRAVQQVLGLKSMAVFVSRWRGELRALAR